MRQMTSGSFFTHRHSVLLSQLITRSVCSSTEADALLTNEVLPKVFVKLTAYQRSTWERAVHADVEPGAAIDTTVAPVGTETVRTTLRGYVEEPGVVVADSTVVDALATTHADDADVRSAAVNDITDVACVDAKTGLRSSFCR